MTKRSKILFFTGAGGFILITLFWLAIKIMMAHFKMPAMPPAVVNVSIASLSGWPQRIDSTGTLSAMEGVTIKPEVAGKITHLYFHSGSDVKSGTPLVELNPAILQAQLSNTQAQMAINQLTYERDEKLIKKGAVSQEELDQSAAALKQTQAQVAQYQAQLDQTLVKAPFAGRVGLRQVNLGDYLNAGSPIVNLERLDPLRVDFAVSEIYLGKLVKGQTVLIRSDAYPKQIFQGKIYALDSLVDAGTQTFAARASINNAQLKLMPGSFVNVTIICDANSKVITVPQTAIVYSADGDYVFKVINGQAKKQVVKIGERRGDHITVASGINAGDSIVTSGQLKIQDGAKVQAVVDKG